MPNRVLVAVLVLIANRHVHHRILVLFLFVVQVFLSGEIAGDAGRGDARGARVLLVLTKSGTLEGETQRKRREERKSNSGRTEGESCGKGTVALRESIGTVPFRVIAYLVEVHVGVWNTVVAHGRLLLSWNSFMKKLGGFKTYVEDSVGDV